MTMTAPIEREEEKALALFTSGGEGPRPGDQDFSEAFAAYQKVEALFDLLRRPGFADPAQPGGELAPGQMLGEFAILQPLASGGMGQVYLARQESLGRLVALKVCKPEIARDPRMKSRFLAEGMSLARLAHPNVVPVLSTGEHQGYLYLAMEYVPGPTLAQVLQAIQAAGSDSLASTVVARVLAKADGSSDGQPAGKGCARLDRAYQTWAVQTLQQVAQGLAAVHQAGILHRDIKPANIVFAVNGVPKIVDFGLARAGQAPSTTVIGEFYGTPAYTSPEQARGDVDAVSPASDVFSFGVTLFECLSLHRPFSGRTSADVLSAVLNADAPLLRQVEKRVPWELEGIADKCLRKIPVERYPSGQALADDLRNYLELRPVSARPPGRIGRVGRMIRRRPWIAAFLVALLGATVLGVFLAKHAWAEYQAERRKTFARRVDEGDVALFRSLTAQRPTWLPAVIEQYRQEGISAYSAALEIDPEAVWPLVQRARLYAVKSKDLDHALADLDKAQQLQPGYSSIRKFRGYVLEAKGFKEEGMATRVEAESHYPTTGEDLYWLGVIAYSKEQNVFGCYTYFSQALLVAPNDYWSRVERGFFGSRPSETNARVRVIPELELARTIRPDVPFASEFIVWFYWKDREHSGAFDRLAAKAELTEQIERFGLDLLRADRMSELLQHEKKYDEAKALLLTVLEQDTGGCTSKEIGDLEYRTGQYAQACNWYRRAISEGTQYSEPYSRLAKSCCALKDWVGAEKAYLDGIAGHPIDASLYWGLGSVYQQMGRLHDEESIYRKACKLPDTIDNSVDSGSQPVALAICYRSLASLLGVTNRPAESVEVLEQGIARMEKCLLTINKDQNECRRVNSEVLELFLGNMKEYLGQVYILSGRRADAISLIDSGLKTRPITYYRAYSLVKLLNRLGMHQKALQISRIAEFATHQHQSTESERRLARRLVNGQLREMDLSMELLDRLETMRASGQELVSEEYNWLANRAQGAKALSIIRDALKLYPESVELHIDYMTLLANAGQKEEAWKAYRTARDLYVSEIMNREIAVLDVPKQSPSSVTRIARPWYTYLMHEARDDELPRLEEHLRDICVKTGQNPNVLRLPRGIAEYRSHRYADATRSLEICFHESLWNEDVSQARIAELLAKSHHALGHYQESIKWYRRAVQISRVDPGLLSTLLSLILQYEGLNGLVRELPKYDQARLELDFPANATLTCFSSWAALALGDQKAAFEKMVQAELYCCLAGHSGVDNRDDALVCGVIIHVVSEQLADAKRLTMASEILKQFPSERVRGLRDAFLLPKPR
jgi:serine/threonine protein kinase/tetratricopeptide (TPR) repeat protein